MFNLLNRLWDWIEQRNCRKGQHVWDERLWSCRPHPNDLKRLQNQVCKVCHICFKREYEWVD